MRNDLLQRAAEGIQAFYAKRRRMPSYAEMLRIFKLRSKNAVYKRINALVDAGLLEKDTTGRIIPKRVFTPLRLRGLIQAGFPSPAEEELQDVMSIDDYLIENPSATFLLKVEGDSMIDAGVHQGDLVLVQRNLTPKNGDIVVAHVDDDWTLKYFQRIGKKVVLKAANKRYPPVIPQRELTVAGVVIANIRKYR